MYAKHYAVQSIHRVAPGRGMIFPKCQQAGPGRAGLDWPLCHCAMAQAPLPLFDEHRRPFEKNEMFSGHLPGNVVKFLCISSCYSKDRWATKKVVTFLHPSVCPLGKKSCGRPNVPPGKKICGRPRLLLMAQPLKHRQSDSEAERMVVCKPLKCTLGLRKQTHNKNRK